LSVWKGKRAFWIAAFLVCALDLVTKTLVFRELGVEAGNFESIEDFQRSRHPVKEVWGDRIRLVAMMNPGMMWGTFREYTDILLWFRMFAVLVILYLLRGLLPEQKAAQVALGAILGGALGNIHDSLRFVGVRDFLELDFDFPPFDPFPSFNVADSAICVGVTVLALGLVYGSARQAEKA
jgi:signal peptidase II